MVTGHFEVHLFDGSGLDGISILPVHVDGIGSRLVSDPYSEILDGVWGFVKDFVDGEDLTRRLLHLSELSEVVPESGLGDNIVWCEDSHLVDWRGWIGLGRLLSANHDVFVEPLLAQFVGHGGLCLVSEWEFDRGGLVPCLKLF